MALAKLRAIEQHVAPRNLAAMTPTPTQAFKSSFGDKWFVVIGAVLAVVATVAIAIGVSHHKDDIAAKATHKARVSRLKHNATHES